MEQKYTYVVFKHIDTIRDELVSIIKTPWYDVAVNLSGKMPDENTYIFYSKMSLGISFLQTFPLSIIKAKLEAESEEQSKICATVRPHNAFLFMFYILILLFILQLVDTLTFEAAGWTILILLFLSLIFLRSLIHFSIGRLKNRFERTLLIKPEEELS